MVNYFLIRDGVSCDGCMSCSILNLLLKFGPSILEAPLRFYLFLVIFMIVLVCVSMLVDEPLETRLKRFSGVTAAVITILCCVISVNEQEEMGNKCQVHSDDVLVPCLVVFLCFLCVDMHGGVSFITFISISPGFTGL